MATKKTKSIGKYPVIKTLKKGGMGVIYLAKHPTLNRNVVIKKLTFRGSKEIKERFKREAELMMDLKSDHIVNVYDHFKVGSTHYLVQEYIDGLSLDEVIKRDGKLSSIDIGIIAFDIAKALKYIHGKGVIHRDIKPGNILLDKSGHGRLTDFGIASLGVDDDIDKNSSLEFLGTPTYMPPEQIDNFQSCDEKGDIYSFGVVLYEMLTGLKPFMGNFSPKLLKDIKKGRFYRIKKMNKQADKFLASISKKSMSRKRSSRYNSFAEIISKLTIFIKRNRPQVKRERISELVLGEHKNSTSFRTFMESSIKEREKKRKVFRKRVLLGISGSIFILFFTSLLYLGYGHRFFNSNKYGSLILSIESDSYPKRGRIKIYDSSMKEMKKVYTLVKTDKNLYSSSDINLKSGWYRVISDNSGIRAVSSVFISPYRTRSYNIVPINLDKDMVKPLDISYSIKDKISGEDITEKVIYTLDKKPLSGESVEIVFKADSYYNNSFIIDTRVNDREINIVGELIPKKGKFNLTIGKANYYDLRINNNFYYISGGPEQVVTPLNSFNSPLEISLNPGRYRIELISKKEVVKVWDVNIISDKITKVSFP